MDRAAVEAGSTAIDANRDTRIVGDVSMGEQVGAKNRRLAASPFRAVVLDWRRLQRRKPFSEELVFVLVISSGLQPLT